MRYCMARMTRQMLETLLSVYVKTFQSPKNPLVRSPLLGKTWSWQVDYPSLSNCRTSAKWQVDE